jgi:hypothetical protein
VALWNEQTSEQRFFTPAFDRERMHARLMLSNSGDGFYGTQINWSESVPQRYASHVMAIGKRLINASREKADQRGVTAFVDRLHDALWTELVPIANDAPYPGRYMGETDAQLRARLSVSMSLSSTRAELEARLALVVAPDHKLELIANATEPVIIRVAVTPPDERIQTAIGFYLKQHVAAGVGLFVDGGPVWQSLGLSIQMWRASMQLEPSPVRMPLRALSDEQLDDAVVECDRMIEAGEERDGKPAEYWAREVVGEQRRRAAV